MLNKLGKLLKYEFRFYFRILPLLYLVLVVLSLLVRFNVYNNSDNPSSTGVSILLLILAWNAMVIAIAVITFILIIQRYIDNFMKDPGALMFTLPVTVWALAAAKVIGAVCMVLMSVLAVVISGLIHFKGADNFILNEILYAWKSGDSVTKTAMAPVGLIMIFQNTCLIYLAITASYLLPKFRFIAGCAIYLAVSGLLEQPVFKLIGGNKEFLSQAALPHVINTGFAALAFTGLYFFATGFLLQRKFNLE